ncbi:ABC transporter ATP-binding protein [Sporosarcina sp. ZBG7A]|uniref:ABC transporter ATP-binding protein n=1 Tax=Sporosarcina sp. ZBG7A TaxID=1582223 RepID=UPI001E2B971F|nr:ABC transporter ATP-binding protein [Sporosarcina sp. ZBG7A]
MTATQKSVKRDIRRQQESGMWKSYIRLLFKTKLPWFWLGFLTFLNIADITLGLLLPAYTAQVASGVITSTVITGVVVVIVVRVLFSGIIRYIAKITSYKIDIRYRKLIWNRLMRSPIKLYDDVKPSEMVSRTVNDTSQISAVISGLFPALVGMIYGTVYIAKVLYGYDWRLSAGLLLYTPVYVLSIIYYGKWNYRTHKYTQNRLAGLTQFLSELLVSIPLIKSFANEQKETERGKDNIQLYYRANMKRSLTAWVNTPLTSILNLVMELFVIVFGIYLVTQGTITIQIWIAFFMYVGMYFGMLETFGLMYTQIKQSQGATSRIAHLVENDLEQYHREQEVDSNQLDLEFNHVTFAYGDKLVLDEVSFTVPYGKVTAIVGPSGGGKSTILALLQQLYHPNDGQISFGGTPIEKFHLNSWRNLFSYVAQDSPLFAGTIRENIMYGLEREVSESELINAAENANILTFINEQPDKFDASVGEGGSSLSGGQRQRIAIARAFLRNSDFLLLDEAMASLDVKSEKAVQAAMSVLMEGRTAIVVAHDLSIIRNADQIILLNEGKVETTGTHDEVLRESDLYRQFVEFLNNTTEG